MIEVFKLKFVLVPLKMSIDQKLDSSIGGENKLFRLICNTNINKNIQHKISWMKDDKELIVEMFHGRPVYKQATLSASNATFANSVLEFNWRLNRTFNFDGDYKCKIHIRYPEVGQGTFYTSEPRKVKFVLNGMFLFDIHRQQ